MIEWIKNRQFYTRICLLENMQVKQRKVLHIHITFKIITSFRQAVKVLLWLASSLVPHLWNYYIIRYRWEKDNFNEALLTNLYKNNYLLKNSGPLALVC